MDPVGLDYPVRPTRLCLDSLGYTLATIPDAHTPLHRLPDDIVVRAQKLPEELAAGAAQRILCLEDRAWFKVRHSERLRGAATRLSDDELRESLGLDADIPLSPAGRWWLGDTGWREGGSEDDFYAALQAAGEREAAGDHKHNATSRWLMPTRWDWLRLKGEAGVAWVATARRNVQHLVARSITCGMTCGAVFQNHVIEATVRADGKNGSFLAFAAEGLYDPAILSVMLTALPGITEADWMEEPGGFAGITPRSGQLIWSTLLTAEQTMMLLSLDDE
jgi:hypothetical protein